MPKQVIEQERRWYVIHTYSGYEDAVAKNKEKQKESEKDRTLHDLYVRLENPLIYDYEGGSFKDKSYSELVQQAIDEGHDGVIMENTRDAFDSDTPSDVIVFFKS